MRSSMVEQKTSPAGGDSQDRWYAGFDDEQFILGADAHWYVESREGEFGPFPSRQAAEDFYYSRFRH